MAVQPIQVYTHGTSTIEIYPTKVIFKQHGNLYITVRFDSILGDNSFHGSYDIIILKVAWNNNAGNSGVFVIKDLDSFMGNVIRDPYQIDFFNLNGYTNSNGTISHNLTYEEGITINEEIFDSLMPIFLHEIHIRGGQPFSGFGNFADVPVLQELLDPDYISTNHSTMYPNNGQRTNRNVPANATNAVSYENIVNGANMVNFQGEFGHGRFYTKNTFNKIQPYIYSGKKRNPFTQQNIEPGNITRYTAKKAAQGGRRRVRKTKKRRVSKKKMTRRRR
jgi:hypothetical protein